jgi:hypothetical protein
VTLNSNGRRSDASWEGCRVNKDRHEIQLPLPSQFDDPAKNPHQPRAQKSMNDSGSSMDDSSRSTTEHAAQSTGWNQQPPPPAVVFLRPMRMIVALLVVVVVVLIWCSMVVDAAASRASTAFVSLKSHSRAAQDYQRISRHALFSRDNAGDRRRRPQHAVSLADTSDSEASETIARRIVVQGDVQGGYYRACVVNEVRCNA